EQSEIWRTLASLEHLAPKTKIELGDLLLKQTRKQGIARHTFWSLTRLGARIPLYGPINCVVPRATAEDWIERLLALENLDDRDLPELDFTLSQLARRSGDRTRDVDDALRERVLTRLETDSCPAHWRRMVVDVTELQSAEQAKLFGDALPPGLRLAD